MRRVIVWRHGQTEHNAGGIWQGQLDTELSVHGIEQARTAAAVLAARGPSLLVSSDLKRAAATAGALAEVSDLEIRYDARLREIHVGTWQGLSQGDVAERYPDEHAALARGEDVVRGEHGERVVHVQQRALQAWNAVLDDLPDDGVAVLATHGVTARTLVAAVVGLTQHEAWMALVGLHNCHWAELVEHRSGWRLDAWNVGAGDSRGESVER